MFLFLFFLIQSAATWIENFKKIKKIHVSNMELTRGDSTQSTAMVCSWGGNAWNLHIARGNLNEKIL
jgi:hypothetical protein